MPQVVQTDLRELVLTDEVREAPAEEVGIPRRRVRAIKDEGFFVAPEAQEKSTFALLALLPPQNVHDERRERDVTGGSRGLRRLLAALTVDHLDTAPNRQARAIEIEVAPTKPKGFSSAQARADKHDDRNLKFCPARGGEKRPEAALVERTHLALLPPRRRHRVAWVAHKEPHAHRPSAQRARRIEGVADRPIGERPTCLLTFARAPSRDGRLDVRRSHRIGTQRPDLWDDEVVDELAVALKRSDPDAMLGRIEPALRDCSDRQAIDAGDARLDFAEELAEAALRLGFRAADRLATLLAFAVSRSRKLRAQIPRAVDAAARDKALHR